MAQQAVAAPGALRSDFRYTPGDGYVYEWSTGQRWITVTVFRTGKRVDTIEFPPERTTAAVLMAAVDTWRAAR